MRPRSAFLAALVAFGCGPSISSIYEGNIRFEHCYRLDLDLSIAPSHRLACWREWANRYTYGQTRDRLEYARRRALALEAGDTARPRLDLASESTAAAHSNGDEPPMPTSLHKPPPPILPASAPPPPVATSSAPPASAAPPDAVEPPQASPGCTADCRANWRACTQPCREEGAKGQARCAPCDLDYRSCMQRCYR